jgi:ribosome-interacting GTPase 1
MPANLTPEFKQAEERFRQAKSPEEKLLCLEEMLATIPKHKGTEKMQADIKTRIAKIRRELSEAKAGGKRQDWYSVEKQGAGQVVIFGPPNCGKSALVKALTGLPAEVAPYPFTTTRPMAGMMEFEDIQIQLIDTPPMVPDSPAWLFHILRTADLLCWLIDLADDGVLDNTEQIQQLLHQNRIGFAAQEGIMVKPLVRVGTKADDPEAQERLAILRELCLRTCPEQMAADVEVLLVSAVTGQGLEEFKRRVFEGLRIIRVYTKKPGKPPDMNEPVILRTGATIIDAAYHLHKDFARKLAYARLWNNSGYSGQRVERTHILNDKDIIEFHINE